MRIVDDVKLDFSDVLLRPKRSTLVSRSDVSLEREYTFRNGGKYKGVPIMAANMDGVGEQLMAFTLAKQGLFTVLKKSLNDINSLNHIHNTIGSDSFSVSMGTSAEEIQKFDTLYKKLKGKLKYVCIDIANGYSRRLADVVEMLRHNYPELIIIAGNVVTAEMVEELLIKGADIIKVGIGSGAVCFHPNMKVNTQKGLVRIINIQEGDYVYTHTGELKEVLKIHKIYNEDKLLNIDGILCTPNHKFYVVDKCDIDSITDENIHNYAKWVPAYKLTKSHLKVELIT